MAWLASHGHGWMNNLTRLSEMCYDMYIQGQRVMTERAHNARVKPSLYNFLIGIFSSRRQDRIAYFLEHFRFIIINFFLSFLLRDC